MKGKIVQARPRKITINGQEFSFLLDMNAIIDLQEEIYPERDALADMAAGKLKAARAVLYAGLRRSLPEGTTIEEMGSMIDWTAISEMMTQVYTKAAEDLPEPDGGGVGE